MTDGGLYVGVVLCLGHALQIPLVARSDNQVEGCPSPSQGVVTQNLVSVSLPTEEFNVQRGFPSLRLCPDAVVELKVKINSLV